MTTPTTEKEKMISGALYHSDDPVLQEERQQALRLCFQLNELHPDALSERERLLRCLLGSVGEDFFIAAPFRCDYGYHITLGNHFYANYNLTILDCAPVTIGENVMIGPNVSIFTAGHPLDPTLRNSGAEFAHAITIGNNVWIGGGAIINPGITIGDNVVIGSGSVLTHDIPSNTTAVGNPAHCIPR